MHEIHFYVRSFSLYEKFSMDLNCTCSNKAITLKLIQCLPTLLLTVFLHLEKYCWQYSVIKKLTIFHHCVDNNDGYPCMQYAGVGGKRKRRQKTSFHLLPAVKSQMLSQPYVQIEIGKKWTKIAFDRPKVNQCLQWLET